jgi:hypothetical protein
LIEYALFFVVELSHLTPPFRFRFPLLSLARTHRLDTAEADYVRRKADVDKRIRLAKIIKYKEEQKQDMKKKHAELARAGRAGDAAAAEAAKAGIAAAGEDSDSDIDDEILDKVERVAAKERSSFYETKVKKLQDTLAREREKRNLGNQEDQDDILEQYLAANAVLQGKLNNLKLIEENGDFLRLDLKARKKRWKTFRKHLEGQTNVTFDTMLGKKGSSGEIIFDHAKKTLDLNVSED